MFSITTQPQRVPRICLNMIVKNESKIITRLLESVFPLIDTYCICDTGSTDNTIDVIQSFFNSKNIIGKVVVEPFRDFGYNRTFALKECHKDPTIDYILLLDADMILRIDPIIQNQKIEEFKTSLTKDAYYIFQGTDTFYYKNVRIVKNNPDYYYWGVTHEYLKTTENAVYDQIEKQQLFIMDIGDGGSKQEKFRRDARLLENGLVELPNNDRYTFYLANTYRDLHEFDKAINMYKKRIEVGGWIEETWHSYYSIGLCYRDMGDMTNAIHYWLEGYEHFPIRIENIYEIVTYYRKIGKNRLAYVFYELGKMSTIKTNDDHLFLHKDIYDFKLEYEFTIIGYYHNYNNNDIGLSCMSVLTHRNNTDEMMHRNILSNYKFYSSKLSTLQCPVKTNELAYNYQLLKTIGDTLNIDKTEFVSSTPSMCYYSHKFIDRIDKVPMKNTVLVNVRFVNYRINEHGDYINRDKIQTINVLAMFDITNFYKWKKVKEEILTYNTTVDNVYVGMEDLRLFSHNGTVKYNANRGLSRDKLVIEMGNIDIDTMRTVDERLVYKKEQTEIEKNWVSFKDYNNDMRIVYNWQPLTIGIERMSRNLIEEVGEMKKSEFHILTRYNTPPLFKYIRGSTNGVTINNEVWFICHIVSYEDRRYYYHIFVVLDAITYELKRFSRIFTFEGEKVEYTLGFLYIEDMKQFMIGYSTYDNETKYMMVTKWKIDEMMIEYVV